MSSAPIAFSGSRLAWADLPRRVRRTIADLAHAEVVSERSATNGFSPGYASLLELTDGTDVFVKAVSPDQNPHSPELARAEMTVARALPPGVAAPELLWSFDDGTWVILGYEAVEGRVPVHPWDRDELSVVLDALHDLATGPVPAPGALRPAEALVEELARSWVALLDDGPGLERAVDAVGADGPWLREHLDDLAAAAGTAPAAARGTSLVHGDLRADNVLLAEDRVWLVDWPHAATGGAAWLDLALMLPSVAMQGGGDPDTLFRSRPTGRDADADALRAVLAATAGFLLHGSVQPPPPGIANLRPFQHAQAVATLDWLRRF